MLDNSHTQISLTTEGDFLLMRGPETRNRREPDGRLEGRINRVKLQGHARLAARSLAESPQTSTEIFGINGNSHIRALLEPQFPDGFVPPVLDLTDTSINGASNKKPEIVVNEHLGKPNGSTLRTEIPDPIPSHPKARLRHFELENLKETAKDDLAQRYLFNDYNRRATLKLLALNSRAAKKDAAFTVAHSDEELRAFQEQRRTEEKPLRGELYRIVEAGLYQAVMEDYGSTSPKEAKELILRHFPLADKSMRYLFDKLFGNEEVLQLRNETALLTSIARAISIISWPHATQELKSEMLRKLLLTACSMQVELTDQTELARKALEDLQDTVSRKMFGGETIANTELRRIRALTDARTGIVMAVEGVDGYYMGYDSDVDSDIISRAIDFEMRRTTDGQIIYTNPNEKEHEAKVIKMVRKAVTRDKDEKEKYDDQLRVETAKDRFRIEYMVVGRKREAIKFMNDIHDAVYDDMYESFFLDAHGNVIRDDDGNPLRRLKDIEPDFETSKNGGTALDNLLRLQIHIPGLYFPIELQVSAIADNLQNRYHKGEKDPETQLYNGESHEFFSDRRFVKVLGTLLGKSYDKKRYWEMIKQNQKNKAQKLTAKDRTTPRKERKHDGRSLKPDDVIFVAAA